MREKKRIVIFGTRTARHVKKRANFSAFHVKHSRQKFLEKCLTFLKFLARGRQCESEVENLCGAEAIKNVCMRMSSLSQARADFYNIFRRGRAHYSAKAMPCQEFFRLIAKIN